MSESHREKQPGFATKAIHSGQDYKQWTNLEIVPPIVTSTTFYEADPLQRTVNNHQCISTFILI